MVVNKFFKNIFNSKLFYFTIGIFLAYLSSLSVLDVESEFWFNDESKFYLWAKNEIGLGQGLLTTVRYYFFIGIIKFYLIFLSDPFYIVFTHKVFVSHITKKNKKGPTSVRHGPSSSKTALQSPKSWLATT